MRKILVCRKSGRSCITGNEGLYRKVSLSEWFQSRQKQAVSLFFVYSGADFERAACFFTLLAGNCFYDPFRLVIGEDTAERLIMYRDEMMRPLALNKAGFLH